MHGFYITDYLETDRTWELPVAEVLDSSPPHIEIRPAPSMMSTTALHAAATTHKASSGIRKWRQPSSPGPLWWRQPGRIQGCAAYPCFSSGIARKRVATFVISPRQRCRHLTPRVYIVIVKQRRRGALTPSGITAAVHRVQDSVLQPEEDVPSDILAGARTTPKESAIASERQNGTRITVYIRAGHGGQLWMRTTAQ
eukprot:COSAG05_NODE_7_length_42457_cov_58.929152_41_plen_197_part_00